MEKDTERLLSGVDADSDAGEVVIVRAKPQRSWVLRASMILNVVLLTLGAAAGVSTLLSRNSAFSQEIFSPAQDAIEYRTQVFRSGLHGDITEYQGSSEEVLQNWEALYNDIGMTQIDRPTAQKLPNATAPTSYDHSQYVVQLDVFHTLHCLNLLRKRLYPDIYPPGGAQDDLYHLEHCVESIRQSLQCSSDVSTIFWEWSEKTQKMMGNLQTTHTCRNFERIQDWARQHSMPQATDWQQFVPGAPLRQE